MHSTTGRQQMDGYVVHGGLGMARGSYARIDEGRGILVYVWEGELWVTQYGDRRDYFVKRGEWFRVDRDGAALIYALEGSQVTITAPTPTDYAERISLTPADGAEARVVYQRSAGFGNWIAALRNR